MVSKLIMNKIILIIIIFSGVISFYLGSFILPNYTEGIGNYLAPSSAKLQIDEQVLPSEESTTQDLEERNFESNLTNEIDTIKKLETSQKTGQIDKKINETQNFVHDSETNFRSNLKNEIVAIEKLEASQNFGPTDGNFKELQNYVHELENRRGNMLQTFDSKFKSLFIEQNRERQKQRDQLVRADARGYQRGKQEILSRFKK